MKELLEASVSLVNVIPTILLVFVLMYWVIVMLGLIDVDAFHLDLDHDVSVEHEIHSTIHTQADLPTKEVAVKDLPAAGHADSAGWMHATLVFFNMGKVPFMIVMSFLILSMWAISVLVNHYTGNTSIIIALALLVPNFLVSALIAKILTTPFVKIFSYLQHDPDRQQVLGQVCTVLLPANSGKIGQAVISNRGNTILLNVKSADGHKLEKGKSAIVLEFNKDKHYYLIQSFDQ
jgi:hypothetical protein